MNTLLPQPFVEYTRQLFGDERFEQYLQAFDELPPVSIRLNPLKAEGLMPVEGERVPWCRHAYYLPQRPNFTMDPLLHAGYYYVQEAASMFLDKVLLQMHQAYADHQPSAIRPLSALDLCAAPGGKSTLMRAALPKDCVLYSNEPIRNRASILAENVQKWGYPNHVVTNSYPRDYRASKSHFDIILCDVPCSGEGMFRKDPATIREWSPQHVEKCWQLQREIVADAWQCLNPGGVLIYSTCTFNTKENEENIRWILSEYDAEVLPVATKTEWHITGSLLEGFTQPVYRFIPGITRGEGLFLCVLRKTTSSISHQPSSLHGDCPRCEQRSGLQGDCPPNVLSEQSALSLQPSAIPVNLDYRQAISYLRGEALTLPDGTPRGEVTVCFQGHPLGLVKNIGSRANNLYPKAWRIKTTHTPADYTPVLT